MIPEAIEAAAGFATLRRPGKKKPAAIEAEMKRAYVESKQAKPWDALATAAAQNAPVSPAASGPAPGRSSSISRQV